jgi:hypothetical protein
LLEISARKTQPIEHAGTFSRPKPPSTRASLIDFRLPGKKRSALRCGRDEQFFHSHGQADDDRDQTGAGRAKSSSTLLGRPRQHAEEVTRLIGVGQHVEFLVETGDFS